MPIINDRIIIVEIWDILYNFRKSSAFDHHPSFSEIMLITEKFSKGGNCVIFLVHKICAVIEHFEVDEIADSKMKEEMWNSTWNLMELPIIEEDVKVQYTMDNIFVYIRVHSNPCLMEVSDLILVHPF